MKNFNKFLPEARGLVAETMNNSTMTLPEPVTPEDIYVVWSCKTLQNAKALLSTDVVSGLYFEVTYNGSRGEYYVDTYEKVKNECIVREEE